MGLKAINVFLLIVLTTCLMQTAFAKPKPRDSSVVEEQSVEPISHEAPKDKEETKSETSTIAEVKTPGRVSCDFEEANEDAVCQEHCLPKGYTYGICVSHTCSCI